VPLSATASAVALFDPMFGNAGLAKWRKAGNGIEVLVQLQPWSSVIVQTYSAPKTGASFPYSHIDNNPQLLKSNWTVEFLSGGPTLPAKMNATNLLSWTEWSNELANFSGTARYSTTFAKPGGSAKAWQLGLGTVHETAEVWLNGKKLATLIGPSYVVNIPASALKETNTLEVFVSNLMANRIRYMDQNNLPWKIFYNTNMPARRRENAKNGLFDASEWKPQPSGLIGPVSLSAVSYD
jgi:hypothetical protein